MSTPREIRMARRMAGFEIRPDAWDDSEDDDDQAVDFDDDRGQDVDDAPDQHATDAKAAR
jgi:hypothetical protein